MTDNVASTSQEMRNYHSILNDSASRKFETYSYLAPMDAAELRRQIQAILNKGWDVAIEHVEPERSNVTYWYMWKLPFFGEWNIDTIINEINACRNAYPKHIIKVIGYDKMKQTQGHAMVVHRPAA
jgi:ribulose-bisphosphate carboxylase small chain